MSAKDRTPRVSPKKIIIHQLDPYQLAGLDNLQLEDRCKGDVGKSDVMVMLANV